jgi:hypothetical protein
MSDSTPKASKKKVLSPAAAERRRARNREYMSRIRQERKLAGIPMCSEQAEQKRREAYKKRYHSDHEFRRRAKASAAASSKRRYAADKTPWLLAAQKRKDRYSSDHEYREKQRKIKRDCSKRRYAASEDVRKRQAAMFKSWAAQNKDHRRQYRRAYKTKRLREDIQFWLSHAIRTRLNIAIRNGFKSGSAVTLLGCSIQEFKKHLESQFSPGMTWKNRGIDGWHIDHIWPLSAFDLSDPQQLAVACNYKNMQPLWEAENLKKKDKVPEGFAASIAQILANSKTRGAKCKTTVRQKKK